MRNLVSGWWTAVILGSVAAAGAWADDTDSRSNGPRSVRRGGWGEKGLIDQWLESNPKDKEKPKTKEDSKKSDTKAPKAANKDTDKESKPEASQSSTSAERRREEEVLLRRLAVCDKLMEIAIRTEDKELLHRAEQLDERTRKAYSQRTAHLPSNDSSFYSDEQTHEKHLAIGGSSGSRRAGSRQTNTDKDQATNRAGKEEAR